MKTSDKLLLGFSLASLGMFGGIHLVLYAEYKNGNILEEKELHNEQFNRFRMPQPRYLSLQGTIWVNILPSDSFYVEFPKKTKYPGDGFFLRTKNEPDPALPRYQQKGDTLTIISSNNGAPVHHPFADPGYEASVLVINVYCRGLQEIDLRNGQVILRGAGSASRLVTARLRLENSTLWVGDAMYDRGEYPGSQNPNPAPGSKENFDSLDVESLNSVILLNHIADIRSLNIRLDKGSEFNDQLGSVEQLTIGCSRDSRISLGGDNLKKAQLSIH